MYIPRWEKLRKQFFIILYGTVTGKSRGLRNMRDKKGVIAERFMNLGNGTNFSWSKEICSYFLESDIKNTLVNYVPSRNHLCLVTFPDFRR